MIPSPKTGKPMTENSTKGIAKVKETLAALRTEEFPDLSEELVNQICDTERLYVEDRVTARRWLERAIEEFLPDSADD